MKRFAFLLCLILALALTLSACNSTQTTVNIRWNDDETYEFDIELADFNIAESATTLFNTYNNKNDTSDTKTYYKDSLISSTESITFASSDQLRPVAAKGTYVMTNKRMATDSANRELTTTQTLYSQYRTEDLLRLNSNILTVLEKAIVDDADILAKFDDNVGKTVLKSTTETGVIFVNDQTQKPISSYNKTDGYYVGATHQELSTYDISTEYDFDARIAKVAFKNADGQETVKENKLGVAKGAYCLDAHQLLLYVRTLGKTDTDFNDSPSKQVYDPYYNGLFSATFALSREFNAVLDNNGADAYVQLNAVAVIVNSSPFMYQINVPDLTAKDLDLGPSISSSDKSPKYTTVRFRVGNYSYELTAESKTQYNITNIITALTTKAES